MVDRNQRAGVRPLSTRDSGPLSENPSAFISPKMLLSVEGHAILFSLAPCPHKSRNPDQSIISLGATRVDSDPREEWTPTGRRPAHSVLGCNLRCNWHPIQYLAQK